MDRIVPTRKHIGNRFPIFVFLFVTNVIHSVEMYWIFVIKVRK